MTAAALIAACAMAAFGCSAAADRKDGRVGSDVAELGGDTGSGSGAGTNAGGAGTAGSEATGGTTTGDTAGFPEGKPPEVIAGTNLVEVDYDNARTRCDVAEIAPARYRVVCAAVALQKDGSERHAEKIKDGTTLAWQAGVVVSGNAAAPQCNVAASGLSQSCEVTTPSASSVARLRFGLSVTQVAAMKTRVESAEVLLPYSVGIAAGFVPSIPFQYKVAAGMQLRGLSLADLRVDYIDAVRACGARVFISAQFSVYVLEGDTLTYYAGSVDEQKKDDLSHRHRVSIGPSPHLFCTKDGVVVGDEEHGRVLWLHDDGRVEAHAIQGLTSTTPLAADEDGVVYYAEGLEVFRVAKPGDAKAFSGGPSSSATFASIELLAVAADKSLYVFEYAAGRIRRIDDKGVAHAFAGDGTLTDFRFMHVGEDGHLYLLATDSVRKIDKASGAITPLLAATDPLVTMAMTATPRAETRLRGFTSDAAGRRYLLGDALVRQAAGSAPTELLRSATQTHVTACTDAPASKAWLREVTSIVVGENGALHVLDRFEQSLRMLHIRPGDAEPQVKDDKAICDGMLAQPAATQWQKSPRGLVLLPGGDVATVIGGVLKRVTAAGVVSDLAGYPAVSANAVARLIDSEGRIYLSDGHKIIRVGTDGTTTVIAGTGVGGFSGDNGPAADAKLAFPTGMLLESDGALLFTDSFNHAVRRVQAGVITTIAGQGGVAGYEGDGGAATAAKLSRPTQIARLASGALLVSDRENAAIRKLVPRTGGGYDIETFYSRRDSPLDCATGTLKGDAAAGNVADAVKTSLGAMCRANPLSVAVHDTCPSAGGRTRIFIGQAFLHDKWVGMNSNILEISQPCAP